MPEKGICKLWQSSEEQRKVVAGEVIGRIPECIKGTYLRVGPSQFDFESGETVNHFFDGYALISKFNINPDTSPQSITFESKYLDSDAYKKAMAAQKPMANEFGTKSQADMGKSYFSKMCKIAAMIMVRMGEGLLTFSFRGRDNFMEKSYIQSESLYLPTLYCLSLSKLLPQAFVCFFRDSKSNPSVKYIFVQCCLRVAQVLRRHRHRH
jgi:carotenoid cleavage dioxygenase-like enzyme